MQRPVNYFSSLAPVPIYDPAEFWFVRFLEQNFETIKEEVLSVMKSGGGGFSPVEEPLVGRGKWDEVIFYEDGIKMEHPCRKFPKTTALMEQIPEAVNSTGVIMLSWIHPGTHIIPHCGATNARLRVHMGIQAPTGASMRIGTTEVLWEEGKCIVFDDSFEHEVWNRSGEPRLILLFDIYHPELSEAERSALKQRQNTIEETIKSFLLSRGLDEIVQEADGRIKVFPDEATTKVISRYMKDHGKQRVSLKNGRLELV